MTLRLADPCDQYASVSQVTRIWTSAGASVKLGSTDGRFGAQAIYGDNPAEANNALVKTLSSAHATLIAAFALKISGVPSSRRNMVRFLDAGSEQVQAELNVDGTVSIYRATTLLATSGSTLATNTWVWFEFKATIADSGGTAEVKVNGSSLVSVTGDTKQTANASANQIELALGMAYTGTAYVDDIVLMDGAGSTNNTFIGDSKIDWLKPNADTAQADFTPLGAGDNYVEVDDSGADDDTTYNHSSTNGHRDLFDLVNLTVTPNTIHGIVALTLAKKTDAGTRNGRNVIKSSTVATGTDTALSTSYTYLADVWETDPNTAAAWTPSAVNSLQAGYEISA